MSSKMGLVVALSLTSLTALYHLILYFFFVKNIKGNARTLNDKSMLKCYYDAMCNGDVPLHEL